jgi:TrmH family RNA methyltransferase
VAVVRPPAWSLDQVVLDADAVVLVLDAVQDPGNVGTMLRTAQALGARGVIALPGTADLYNSKVLRGSMGALFRLPCVCAPLEEVAAWFGGRGTVWLTDPGGVPAGSLSWRGRRATLLVVGNEGAGLSDAVSTAFGPVAQRVGIPLAAGAESLNVAVAAGILLYEVLRGK